MDLKVHVEGVLREVCGVSELTTCEEVIFMLAQAASLPGFYTLVATHRGRETTLSPEEKIVQFIHSIKEQPNTVQFTLRRLEALSPRSSTSTIQSNVTGHQQLSSSSSSSTRSSNRHQVHTASYKSNLDPPVILSHNSTATKGSFSPKSQQHQPNLTPPKPVRSTHNPTSTVAVTHLTISEQNKEKPKSLSSGSERSQHEFEERRYLEDQLAYQEQQVELNRIRLLRFDKEINELENTARLTTANANEFTVGPAAELAQLTATPWLQRLDENRKRHRELLHDRERHQQALERVNVLLTKAQDKQSKLDREINVELQRLLIELEACNTLRQQRLRSVSPPKKFTRPSALNASEGVPI